MKANVIYTVGSETLQTILITSLKTLSIYEQLLCNTQNEYISDWLLDKIKQSSKFILEVQVALESMDMEPRSLSKVQLFINKMLFDLKLLFADNSDEYIISEILKADMVYLNHLSKAQKSILITDDLYQIYSKQIESIRMKPTTSLGIQNILLG